MDLLSLRDVCAGQEGGSSEVCLCFPGVAVVQREWRMLSSRDGGFGVSGTCWTLGSRVWGLSVCEWSLLGSGEQGFWCRWKMLGSRDWVLSVIRGYWALVFFFGVNRLCWTPGTGVLV